MLKGVGKKIKSELLALRAVFHNVLVLTVNVAILLKINKKI